MVGVESSMCHQSCDDLYNSTHGGPINVTNSVSFILPVPIGPRPMHKIRSVKSGNAYLKAHVIILVHCSIN